MTRGSAAMGSVHERWVAMPPAQRRLLLTCFAALVALSAVSAWWGMRTDWRTLFSGMEGRDAAVMQQQLTSAGITYQTTPDGTALQVPAEQLDKARVAISAGGLPQSGRMGFELFDKPNWIGSEFDEKVNYRRALEGELEHTIGSLESVRSARVHIVLPKQGAFASEDQPAKASAVLKLRRSNLPRPQSDAIRNLVAGAVEGLKPEAVTLVDADGHVDLSPDSRSGEDRENELALQNKLIQVLEPLAGVGNVHATVSVSYVEGGEERTDEVYDPQSAIPVSTQRTEQTMQATRSMAIAGASANTPAAQPVAAAPPAPAVPAPPAGSAGSAAQPAAAAQAPAAPGQTQTSREENSSYAVSRHVTHSEQLPGRVRRLTAAIVVNDREIQQRSGKVMHTTWQHRSPDELQRLQQLAQAAVGFAEDRGDQVVLENVAFSGNTDPGAVTGISRLAEDVQDLLRAQPALPRTIATVLGLLLLGLLVLRPLTRQTVQLMQQPYAPQLLPAGMPATVPALAAAGVAGMPERASTPSSPGAAYSTQEIFDRVSQQIKAEPQSSTRLVSSWIGASEEDI